VSEKSTNITLSSTVSADGDVGDYIALLKPRVMSLVVFTAFAGLYLAPGSIHPVIAIVAVLCIAVGAGASGAINMWYDRDIDAVMDRTAARPIPSGRIQPGAALGFGVALAAWSVMVMGLAVEWSAAALLAFTICFYVFVYTIWLKRRTPQNIVIGGAAGAFPPMVGWSAVTGDITFSSIILFAIIFMWTPPHFWALALYRRGDYEKAGVPMMPVVAGERETKRQIILYTVLLVPITLAPTLLGISSWFYGFIAVFMGLVFVSLTLAIYRDSSEKYARLTFVFSILYLFIIFTTLVVDKAAGF
tara:strand:- start:1008 stop:1916 length:909 start_codon:yes stop_codon:yes gene_type:complete